jgi:phytoene dehydrogenase-like protein
MLFCPVMYYGSASERDMEFGQFVIMFKALFLEGFARPFEGVRTVIRVLLEKYRAAGGERRMKCGVQRIVASSGRATALVLDDGSEVTADHVISSIGAPETEQLVGTSLRDVPGRLGEASLPSNHPPHANVGRHSFVETITVLNQQPAALGWGDDTIIFFNDSARFDYACPAAPVDLRSGVICIPNNFDFGPGRELPEGVFRVTCLAKPQPWFEWDEATYAAAKRRWFGDVQASARRFLPPVGDDVLAAATVATDMFTPRTITKYTGHLNGAIYGAPQKVRDGRTAFSNLYLCGTDQGFLGIVGAMLSGISMANYHILQKT